MSLGDDLLLLAIGPRRGGIQTDSRMGYTLRAAQLADLMLAGCVAANQNRLHVTGAGEVSDARLQKVLSSLTGADHELSVKRYLMKVPRSIMREHLSALRLAGLIADVGRPKLSVQPVRLTRAGRGQQARLRERIDAIAHGRDAEPDERDLALAGLVHACGLDARLYSGLRGRAARKRLAACIDVRTVDTIAGPARAADSQLADDISQALSNGVAVAVREVYRDWGRTHHHSMDWPTWDNGGYDGGGGHGGGGYDGGGHHDGGGGHHGGGH